MRSKAAFLLPLLFLHGCTTGSRPREDGPPAQSAGSSQARTADAPAAAADPVVERSYRSAVPICVDAALRVFRERDVQILSQESSGGGALLRGQTRSFAFTLSFSRSSGEKTRAVLQLRGRGHPEDRDEAARLLDRLSEALLEPRD